MLAVQEPHVVGVAHHGNVLAIGGRHGAVDAVRPRPDGDGGHVTRFLARGAQAVLVQHGGVLPVHVHWHLDDHVVTWHSIKRQPVATHTKVDGCAGALSCGAFDRVSHAMSPGCWEPGGGSSMTSTYPRHGGSPSSSTCTETTKRARSPTLLVAMGCKYHTCSHHTYVPTVT